MILKHTRIARIFYCVAVDTIGGPSKSIPNKKYKSEFDKIEWIRSIIDYFGYEKVNIVGISNGACMVFNFTEKHPDRIDKTVCIEGGLVLSPMKSIVKTIGLLFPEVISPTENNMMKIFYQMTSPESKIFQGNLNIIKYIILLMKAHDQNAMFPHKFEKYEIVSRPVK